MLFRSDALYDAIAVMKELLRCVPVDPEAASNYHNDTVIPAMKVLRREADVLEALTDKAYWPYPTYSDLLFY